MIEEIPLTDPQRNALAKARINGGELPAAASQTLSQLDRKGLIVRVGVGHWRWTEAGRRCVLWFADDCAEHWGVSTGTWNRYVTRGTAPEPDYLGTPRSTTDRAWWKPETVRTYVRPGQQAGPESQRVQFDSAEVIRTMRGWQAEHPGGPPLSINQLAIRFCVSPTTMAAFLERIGEKEPTSASLRAGNGPNTTGITRRLVH